MTHPAVRRLTSLVAATDMGGLGRRGRGLTRAAISGAVAAVTLCLCALSIWLPPAAKNSGFSTLDPTANLSAVLGDHGLTPVATEWATRLELGEVVVTVGSVLVGNGLIVLFLLRRRTMALIGLFSLVLINEGWRTFSYQTAYDTLPANAATFRAIAALEPDPRGMTAAERSALTYLHAQVGYLHGDVAETQRRLNGLDLKAELPSFLANWRLAIMQDWVSARGGTISPGTYQPVNIIPNAAKRTATWWLWLTATTAAIFAGVAAALATVIGRRTRQLALLVASVSDAEGVVSRSNHAPDGCGPTAISACGAAPIA